MKNLLPPIKEWWNYYEIFTLVYFSVDLLGAVIALVGWKVLGFNPMGLWGWDFLLFVIISLPQFLFGFFPAILYCKYGHGWQLALPTVALLIVNIVFYAIFVEGIGRWTFFLWIPTLSACGPFSLFIDSFFYHNIYFCDRQIMSHVRDFLLAPLTYLAITYATAAIIKRIQKKHR